MGGGHGLKMGDGEWWWGARIYVMADTSVMSAVWGVAGGHGLKMGDSPILYRG